MDVLKFNFDNQKLYKQVKKIRTEVFIIGQNCPVKDEFDEFERTSTHFLIYYNEKPAATSRWRETNEGIKLERFAVLNEFRGNGLANILIETMLKDVAKKDKHIYLYAQEQVTGLYEKFGFIIDGEKFEEVGIVHYKMILEK